MIVKFCWIYLEIARSEGSFLSLLAWVKVFEMDRE
jgi:hypothetical protein